MATSRISEFKAKFLQGARPNLFSAVVAFPTGVNGDPEKASFMIKGASLPGSTIGEIPVPYRGRNLYVAGDRTFEPWEITVINDVDFAIRNSFTSWLELITKAEGNITEFDTSSSVPYYADMEIHQLDRDEGGNRLKTYKFIDTFPTAVSQIDLAADSNDTVEEFTVTLRYNYYEEGSSSSRIPGR